MRFRSLRRSLLNSRIWILLAIVGPGIITANADNDATGILGYSLAGVQYGYAMLWVLVLSTFALGIAQEICARMGAVTGKGLADLIREEYGVKITILAMLTLLVANFATTIAEFAGILAAVQVFLPPGIREEARFIAIPLMAFIIWLLVLKGTYLRVERILLAASVIYLGYIVSAVMAHPPWGHVLKETVLPSLTNIGPMNAYIFMVINVIGTTITPWGQFYVQSAVRDKGIKAEEYGYERADVIFGAFFTNFIAFFIIVACAKAIFYHPELHITNLNDAGQAALALRPFAGQLAFIFFAVGLFNASCFGAIIVPLSTAYAVTEALGWESGLGRRVREAPLFIGVFTFLIFTAALTVILFPKNLTALMILPNVIGGVLLPIILVLMQLLVNKRRIMGHFVNGKTFNIISWLSTIILTLLSLILLITQVFHIGN
jgi:NRAMP (natural resistance-associated macrophage protein)-like metal ion transporter